MADVNSIADFKRALIVGATLQYENYKYPEMSGPREIVRVQSERFAALLPVGHPRYDEVKRSGGSYMSIPKRSEATFIEGSMIVWYVGTDAPFCKITLTES